MDKVVIALELEHNCLPLQRPHIIIVLFCAVVASPLRHVGGHMGCGHMGCGHRVRSDGVWSHGLVTWCVVRRNGRVRWSCRMVTCHRPACRALRWCDAKA